MRADDRPAKRLLLLTSGRIVEGRISQTAGGYLVEKSKGSMLVPFEHVRLEAVDRREAYRKLRRGLPERTATRHIALARWCLSQHLFDEARIELRDALLLEPHRREARSMLRRLDEVLRGKRKAESGKPKKGRDTVFRFPLSALIPGVSPPWTLQGFEPPEASSLAGLSREAGQQFVTRIQPILMNKCASARCHGPAARNEFRLTRVRSGQSHNRVSAERNLAATLRFVDIENPDESPLLSVDFDNHGRGARTIFYGPRGSDQLAALRRWVRGVAGERSKARERERRKPSLVSARKRYLREKRTDAFDPELFNRAAHGKKRTRR